MPVAVDFVLGRLVPADRLAAVLIARHVVYAVGAEMRPAHIPRPRPQAGPGLAGVVLAE